MIHPVLAIELAYWQETAIKVGVAALLVPLAALILGYVFLLKMMSFMQSRLGPMEAGPYGVLQNLADGVKFLQKEDIFPERADRFVFAAAPIVVLVSTLLMYVFIPVGTDREGAAPGAVVQYRDRRDWMARVLTNLHAGSISKLRRRYRMSGPRPICAPAPRPP